jgi:hypothetical protein
VIVEAGSVAATSRDFRDAMLLVRLRRRDVTALDELYRRHGTLAYSVALRLAGDPVRAAAAVERAFLSIWREPPAKETVVGLVIIDLIARSIGTDGGANETHRDARPARRSHAERPRHAERRSHAGPSFG